jgi:hypothetical protein
MSHDRLNDPCSPRDDAEIHVGWERWKWRWGRLPVVVLIGTWLLLFPTLSVVIFFLAVWIYVIITEGIRTLGNFAFMMVAGVVLISMIIMDSVLLYRVSKGYWSLRHKEYSDERSMISAESEGKNRDIISDSKWSPHRSDDEWPSRL